MALIRSVTLFSLLLVTLFTVSCAQNAMTNTYLFEGIGISKNQSNEAYIFSYVLYDSKDENDQVKTLLPRNIARLNLTGVSEKTLIHRFSSVYIPVRYPTKRSIFSILPRYYYMQLNRQYENQVNQSFISTSIMVHDTLKKRTYRILFTHTNIYDLILVNEQNTYKLKWITPSLNKSICALMMREVNWFSLIERMNATSEDNEDETYEDLYTQHCLEHDRSRSFVPSNNNYTLTTLKAGQIFSFALSYKLVKVYAWRRNFNDVYIETGWSGKFFQVPRLNCYKPEGSFVQETTPSGGTTKIITIRITCPENALDVINPAIYFKFNPYGLSGGLLYRPAIQIPPTSNKAISFLENDRDETLVHFANPDHLVAYHNDYANQYCLHERKDLHISYDRPKFIYQQIPLLHDTFSYGINVRG